MKTLLLGALISIVCIALLYGCDSRPKVTPESIRLDLAGKTIGAFACQKDTIKDVAIVESTYKGDKATIIVDLKTADSVIPPLSGRLRLHYQWTSPEWKLTMIENLTFRESRT